MKAIKKINNNVVLCVDGNDNELIAFGKGIGFPPMPYEIDLEKISMTFYKINKSFYNLIQELPENVLETSAIIVSEAKKRLNCELNPNLIISLADHINFAIIRLKKYKEMKFIFSFDIEQFYPEETELGRYAVKLVQKRLHYTLPESEITNIAMHFVNAEEEQNIDDNWHVDTLITEITKKIEDYFSITIEHDSFTYNRFAVHLRYYLARIREKEQYSDDNHVLLVSMKESYPDIYEAALEVSKIIERKYEVEMVQDELLYLMIHINRIVTNTE